MAYIPHLLYNKRQNTPWNGRLLELFFNDHIVYMIVDFIVKSGGGERLLEYGSLSRNTVGYIHVYLQVTM